MRLGNGFLTPVRVEPKVRSHEAGAAVMQGTAATRDVHSRKQRGTKYLET